MNPVQKIAFSNCEVLFCSVKLNITKIVTFIWKKALNIQRKHYFLKRKFYKSKKVIKFLTALHRNPWFTVFFQKHTHSYVSTDNCNFAKIEIIETSKLPGTLNLSIEKNYIYQSFKAGHFPGKFFVIRAHFFHLREKIQESFVLLPFSCCDFL